MAGYYPIMVDINNKECLVIGGGEVAERKIFSLWEYGAKVTVISPKVTEKLYKLFQERKISLIQRIYKEGDMKDYYLVYVATNDPRVNASCFQEAEREEILINVVDQPKLCRFIVPAVIRKGDLTVAVSTNGKSPMLSRKIKEDIEALLDDVSEEYLDALGELRNIVMEEVKDINKRKTIFEKIVYSDLPKKLKQGEIKDISKAVKSMYQKEKDTL